MLAPILVVCWVAFTPEGFLSFPTDRWSLRWFYAIGRYPEFVSAFWRSLWLGALSSAVAVRSRCRRRSPSRAIVSAAARR
jgi:ABC-type spermidine/putrescine transport system, permease component II